ncbi:hypothetical protein Anas_13857 [Armadillidium nasatum]|uniref:Uncharacterized protein n=1 Tax=Armadillidium nasatum TaxID=96803 RepID=A0A5N5T766_9CRUS|nr:hypothetical protein Anas_13857 [Armadillidium nasatum]
MAFQEASEAYLVGLLEDTNLVKWKIGYGEIKLWINTLGLTIRSALSGEPWELVGGLPREEIASLEGVNKIMSVLEKKYSSEKKRVRMDSVNAFFRIEMKPMEDIQDFVSRFDVVLRRCNAAGMAELGEEHKGGLLLGRSKLSENEEKIMLGVLDGNLSYERVTSLLVGIMERVFRTKTRKKSGIVEIGIKILKRRTFVITVKRRDICKGFVQKIKEMAKNAMFVEKRDM